MSNDLAMTMDELVRESAELLPARETLCVAKTSHHGSYGTSYTNNDFNPQVGLVNINQSSILSNDNFNILGIQL
jgi:hypothetical protein